jgi:hypothetical protein
MYPKKAWFWIKSGIMLGFWDKTNIKRNTLKQKEGHAYQNKQNSGNFR